MVGLKVMVGEHVGQSEEGFVTCRKMPEQFPIVN